MIDQPLSLYSDNEASLAKPAITWRNRHFSMMASRLRQEVSLGNLVWSWMSGKEIPADGLTKVLTTEALRTFREAVGLIEPSSR